MRIMVIAFVLLFTVSHPLQANLTREAIQEYTLKYGHGNMSAEAQAVREDIIDYLWQDKNFYKALPFLRDAYSYLEQNDSNKKKLMKTRFRLGKALRIVGETEAAIEHLSAALEFRRNRFGEDHHKTASVMIELGTAYVNASQAGQGVALLEQAVAIRETHFGSDHPKTAHAGLRLGQAYTKRGDFEKAERLLQDAYAVFDLKKGPLHKGTNHALLNLGKLYRRMGRHDEAERVLQKAFTNFSKNSKRLRTPAASGMMSQLGKALAEQGRYAEAEQLLRRSADIRQETLGPNSSKTIGTMNSLADVLLKQGNIDEAETVVRGVIDHLSQNDISGRGKSSYRLLTEILLRRNKLEEARQHLEQVLAVIEHKESLGHNNISEEAYLTAGELYNHLQQYDKASHYLQQVIVWLKRNRGNSDPRTINAIELLAQARAGTGDLAGAVTSYRQAIKANQQFLAKSTTQSATGRAYVERRGRDFMHRYMNLMVDAHVKQLKLDTDPVNESFNVAENTRSRSLQTAMLGMAARAAARNQFLADLVRKEQDLKVRLGNIEDDLLETIRNFGGKQDSKAIRRLTRKREGMTGKLEKIHRRLAYEYPEYSQLINPVPITTPDMQALLADHEIMLSYLVQPERTLLWAVTNKQTRLYTVNMGQAALADRIKQLRQSLEANATSVAELPPFQVGIAHLLYTQLVAPTADLLQDKQHVIVVPDGPLMSLPFGALVTKKTRQPRPLPGKPPFSEYRDVPWLALAHAISIVSSATALHTLRKYAKPAEASAPFVGYGNPTFSGSSDANTSSFDFGFMKRASANSWDVRELPPLPDTADEIRSIAHILGADESDIYLGSQANENNVKHKSLADYKVVAFATHGLVSGELDGLKQPALALTPPDEVAEGNDGLLEMGEVLELKLDADWVVLSACNTAAADGSLHGEGLTGLAQAFFYAGSRALLVSLWPVESSSTRLLTTTLFDIDKKNGGVSRARALARARQRLIKGEGYMADNKEQFSYAHPMFWASFIVVGEGNNHGAY